MKQQNITVVGAGVLGLWQGLTLARAGHKVRVLEESKVPFANAASRWAGAMLAPDCEAESAPPVVRDFGRRSLGFWQSVLPDIAQNGTLVVASVRDASELKRFARATERHETLGESELGRLEPSLAGRFSAGLFYAHEAHFDCMKGLAALLAALRQSSVQIEFATRWNGGSDSIIIDCRGLMARRDLPNLRGVRGERLLVRTNEVSLSRPVRLLHPRQPIYVVPQGDGRFVVGATVIEREDDGPMTVRSALELLGSAYALHPAFAEAAILDMGAGVRPAFPDNVPRVLISEDGKTIRVNGAYRHGFLLAPILADAVANHISRDERSHPLIAMATLGQNI